MQHEFKIWKIGFWYGFNQQAFVVPKETPLPRLWFTQLAFAFLKTTIFAVKKVLHYGHMHTRVARWPLQKTYKRFFDDTFFVGSDKPPLCTPTISYILGICGAKGALHSLLCPLNNIFEHLNRHPQLFKYLQNSYIVLLTILLMPTVIHL